MGLVLIITNMIKPEIVGHVVKFFFRKYMNVHHIHSFLYEEDE